MKTSTYATMSNCTACGLSDAAAEATTEAAEREAARFSNPNIPWPLKLTGLALIVFFLTRNS